MTTHAPVPSSECDGAGRVGHACVVVEVGTAGVSVDRPVAIVSPKWFSGPFTLYIVTTLICKNVTG